MAAKDSQWYSIMKRFNSILTIIFIVSMIAATVALGIAAYIFKPCPLVGDLFCYWVLVMIAATIGLWITPIDLYEGYQDDNQFTPEELAEMQRLSVEMNEDDYSNFDNLELDNSWKE